MNEPAIDEDKFYSGAIRRITNLILVLGVLALPLPWIRAGWRAGIGWSLGAAVSYVNFRSLTGAVEGLADRITVAGKRETGRKIVGKFLFRYILFGAAAYVIFKYSEGMLHWALAGLFLPVAATMCEAAYELINAPWRET
jgi:hypothetical protein